MSLSLDQLFQSPNEEKKVQLQNRPFIGDESSDECSDDEKTKLPHQTNNKSSSSSLNYKNEHILKNDINNKIDKPDNKNDLNQRNDNHSQFLNQLKEQTNQLNYASFSSNQILRNSKEMSNNNLTNNNYPINFKSASTSSNKQNERIKYRKSYYNDDFNDYEHINKSDILQQDNLLNDYKNELSQNEIKNSDQNDLINHKPASALIKRGDLFKNVDYFNKNSINDLDDDLYSNRKIERRKIRKNSLINYQQQQPQKDILQQSEFELNKNKEIGRLIIDKRDNNSLNRVTRYENKQRNYHHYIHKDTNSKRASISSAEISKYDTLSSSSSASPTQDLRKQDLNDIICIENKQYKGYELEDVLNIDNQNRMKNLKDYSNLNSNSFLDDDLNKIKNSQSNQKLAPLNDLITIEPENLGKNLINDIYPSSDFSSSLMHKSTKSVRKSSIDKSTDFNLVDLNTTKNELNNLDKIREPSPELLKFNDEDYDEKQFTKNVNIKSDLLTDDDGLKNFTTLDNDHQSTQINLISSTSSFLQPKIINTNALISNINDNNSNSLINDLDDLNELNDQDEPDSELKDLNDNNIELINQPQINNNNIDIDELDKDDGIGSDGSQNDLAIAQSTSNKTIQLEHNNRRSSGECSSIKDFNNCKEKETKIIYSNDLKMNSLINSQLDSSTNSESSFNSTVMSNRIKNSKQNTNLTTESNSPVTSLDGQLSPKRNNNLKTPGYTQRILNSNNEKIKYGLFQLGTNNVSNSLIDMDMEPIEADRIKEDELNDNEKLTNNTMQKDISRDELVKSILNIPFSSNYDLDQNEDDEQSSLNSSLNSNHKASQLKANYLNFNNKQQQQERELKELQYISNDLENLNLNNDKNNFKEHAASNVTNRNASLGDIRLNNSSGCKQIKESNSVNSQLNNLNNNNQNINFSNVNNKNNSKNRKNNLLNSQSMNDHQDLNDCLDMVLDKSTANNINFVSNSMSNSSLLNNKSTKMSNGRLPDYMLNDNKNDDQQKEKNVIDNEFNKKEDNDKKDRKDKIEKDNKMYKEELLIETIDLIGSTNSTTTIQFNQQNNNQKYFNNNKKESSFEQHQIQSKILQETVTNHLLSDSLVDVSDDAFNSTQFESNNKKSTNKHYNDLCYLDNTHNRIDKNNSSRNLINSKYNNHNGKTSEDSLRNFSLSPETTDCDSIIESEFSISSFVSVPGGLNQMPILEDGLSSCSESDTETQTIRMDDLMKKQKHHHQQQNKLHQQGNESPELFPKCRPRVKKNQHLSDYDMNSDNYNSNQSNLCDDRDGRHLKKSRSLNLNNNNNMHLNNGLDSSEEHTTDNLNSEQLWNQKLQQSHQTQQQNRGHYNQSIGENQSDNEVVSNSLLKLNDEKPKLIEKTFHEDDCDTDQETDRLLGAQRTEDKQFFDERVQTLKKKSNSKEGSKPKRPSLSRSVLIEGVLFRARYLGSTQLKCEGTPTKATRMSQAEEAVSRIKAPEGEAQPSTEVDLFISTEKIMVLNTDLKEIMMDHSLRTISYIADIGDLLVLMARRRQTLPNANEMSNNISNMEKIKRPTPLMICHVFESDEAQFIAQSIGQAFQVAYMEYLKANGIEDSSFIKEMDYQEVLNSQEIFGNELEMFARKEKQKEVIVPKKKGEILGIVIVESGWGSMLPTCVVANMAQQLPAARCGAINIGDQIIAINGISLVGLPLSNCQNYIKSAKNQTAVKLTIVPCAPVVEVKIKRPDTKYQLGFSVQNGVICSLLRGGIAERGGVRVGHRIIEINGQSVVAVVHDKIVNLLATSVGEIHMKTMPTSMFRLLTGQDQPVYL